MLLSSTRLVCAGLSRCPAVSLATSRSYTGKHRIVQVLSVSPLEGYRFLSASSLSSSTFAERNRQDQEENPKLYGQRHDGIGVHPDSISSLILPGNFVFKKTRRGKIKKIYTELVHGYFWMIKDLERSNEKPIQSNELLIPREHAKVFPYLPGLESVSGNIRAAMPDYILRKNRSKDAAAQCTLVAISFRDHGYRLLPSWLDPFQEALAGKDRVELVRLNLSEGWFNKYILGRVIRYLTRRNTPAAEQDSTFLYSGGSGALEPFRDALRMHNLLTGYVFLLDGLGRVRFAGSGSATEEEVERLVRFAKELTPLLKPHRSKPSFSTSFRPASGKHKKISGSRRA